MTTPQDQALLFHSMRLAASVDGEFGGQEAAFVRAVLSTLPDFRDAALDALPAQSSKLAKEHGGLLESAAALGDLSTEELKRKAYVLATEVAYSSAGVSSIERDLMKMLRTVLGIDAGTAKQIHAVVGWKYL